MNFSIGSIGHAFAIVGQDIVKEAKVVAQVLSKLKGTETVVESITALVDPQAVVIERAAYQALGMIVGAANDTSTAATANGLSIPADAQTIADFKALAAYLQAQFTGRGVAAPLLPAAK